MGVNPEKVMWKHCKIEALSLRSLIRKKQISFAGNSKLKIFGELRCTSGERMKKENRVFFYDLSEARAAGYRPCAHCMHIEYKKWKNRTDERGEPASL